MSGIFANKVVTLIILGLLIGGTVAGVALVRQQQILKSKAACETVCDEHAQGACTHYKPGECIGHAEGECTHYAQGACTHYKPGECIGHAEGACTEWNPGYCASYKDGDCNDWDPLDGSCVGYQQVCDNWVAGSCDQHAEGDCNSWAKGDCDEWAQGECDQHAEGDCNSWAKGDCDEWAQGECIKSHESCDSCNGHAVGDTWQGACTVGGQRTYLKCESDGAISSSQVEDATCSSGGPASCTHNDCNGSTCGSNQTCETNVDGNCACLNNPNTAPTCSQNNCNGAVCNSNQTCQTNIDGNCACINNPAPPGGGTCAIHNPRPECASIPDANCWGTYDSDGTCNNFTSCDSCAACTPSWRTLDAASYCISCTEKSKTESDGCGNTRVTTVADSSCQSDSTVCVTSGNGGPRPGPVPPGGGPTGNTCSYPETCTLSTGGTGVRTCTGTMQGGACKWDSSGSVSPNCTSCAAQSTTPTPSPTPRCSTGQAGSITQDQANCVAQKMPSLVTTYKSNGWCTGAVDLPGIVNNWVKLPPPAADQTKVASCFPGGVFPNVTPAPGGSCSLPSQPSLSDACASCIKSQPNRNNLPTEVKNLGSSSGQTWAGCADTQLISQWCSSIDANSCTSFKNGVCASSCNGSSVSPSPSAVPTAYTVAFRVAEDPTGFTETGPAGWQPYTAEGMTVDHDFVSTGQKFIFVQFKDSNNKITTATDCPKCQAQIKILGTLTGSCALTPEGNNTLLTLTGQNFGTAQGTVKNNDTSLQIRSWKNDVVKAVWPNTPTDQTLAVTLTSSDGQSIDINCSSVSQLSVGAKVFCRQPSSHQTNNVDLVLVGAFEGGKKISQKVNIDKEGVIQGLTTKLEVGKDYKLSLKAPKSLRRSISFKAAEGTTNVFGLVLPVGDIFPADGGDGRINAFDHNELVRQWNISGDATGRSGDFNLDGKVNSVDWACMRTSMPDAVNGDDPEPTPGSSI